MYTKLQSMVDRLNNVVQEGLTAIRAVKAFVRDEYEEDKFNEVNTGLTAASEQTFHYAVLNLPAFQGVMYTAIVLILWFGGNMILKKQLAVGNLTGFLSYVMQVMNSMMMIANVFLLLTRSMASAHRIVEVLDEKIVLTSPENGVTEVTEGSVEFDNVSFKYKEEAKEYALSDVTLKIKAGQTVGILGGTGSSKTTLVQLIPRLYDTSRGTVRVGGKDVRAYDLAALRDAVNIILQKNVLFSGTVRENLKWGNVDASDEEIWEACRAACADEFLNRMPDGLDTVLEQGASNLSGGQKQRLCIARALIGKAKILIFDDSTSAVDTATEKKIREALAARKNVTKIIIAQRVTSVMNTDQIIILDDGKVHRIGTHAELLADDPIYQEIYASQMKEETKMAARAYSGKKPKNLKHTLRVFLSYLGRHKKMLAVVAVLVTISAGANLLGTYMIRPVVNGLADGDVHTLLRGVLITALIFGCGALAAYGYTQTMVKAAQQVVFDIRRDLFEHVQTLPLQFFDSRRHGDIMSLFTNDIDTMADALNNSFAMVIQSFIQIVGTLTLLYILNWRLSLIVTVCYGIMFWYIKFSGKRSKGYYTKQQNSSEN